MKEMNGSVKFLFRIPGGSVISESSLKEIRKLNSNYKLDPVTGKLDEDDSVDEEWITINPKPEEGELMKELWLGRVAKEKEEKRITKALKSKRKSLDPDSLTVPKTKKLKSSSTAPIQALPSTSILIPSLSKKLAEKLAEDKKKFSPAVAALYEPKGGDANHDADGRSNWMTRGAFTRYA